MISPSQLERWQRIERVVLSVVAVLSIGTPILRFFLGYGVGFLFLIPVGLWCIWQAFFEDLVDESTPPSVTERVFYYSWLWVRRIIVGGVGIVFISIGIYAIRHPSDGGIAMAAFPILLGVLALWIGFFGGGRRGYGSDVLVVYRKRKARYKWRP